MGFADDLKDDVLDLLFGSAAHVPPDPLYVALSTTQPADDGSNVTEPVGGSYARVSVANDLVQWAASVGGVKTNVNNISFPAATADWGTVGWFAIYDAALAGNMIHWGTIQTARTILNGDTFRFLAGDLTITLTSA